MPEAAVLLNVLLHILTAVEAVLLKYSFPLLIHRSPTGKTSEVIRKEAFRAVMVASTHCPLATSSSTWWKGWW